LVYRAKHLFFIKQLKNRHSKKKNLVVVPRIDFKNIKDLQLPTICGKTSERLAKKILNGKRFTFNAELEAIRRYKDKWCNSYFSDIKTTDQDPDLRLVWEPARLQHITILINYILQNENQEFIDNVLMFAKNSVLKWIHENPFPCGPHYISAMECGLRIPLFLYCLKVLDNLSANEFQLILDTLYCHAWLISNRLSLYSSIGNHTIAEANGLVFGGAVFRYTAEGQKWLSKGHALLEKELNHQIMQDGDSYLICTGLRLISLKKMIFIIVTISKNVSLRRSILLLRLKMDMADCHQSETVMTGMPLHRAYLHIECIPAKKKRKFKLLPNLVTRSSIPKILF
jgi:hypothetical protein